MTRISAGRPSAVGRSAAVSMRGGATSVATAQSTTELRTVRDVATIAGIPEAEMTPNVRTAIHRLMEEISDLRQQLAAAHKNNDRLEQMADEDPLLPVLNRRAFVRELSRAQALTQRHGIDTSLLYLDVNSMKQINDTHGHSAGDAVLVHISNSLRENLRESDIVGRLGGDEFGVILLHADDNAAAAKAHSLVTAIRSKPVSWNGTDLIVSVAYGHTTLGEGEVSEALELADRAMYATKVSKRS